MKQFFIHMTQMLCIAVSLMLCNGCSHWPGAGELRVLRLNNQDVAQSEVIFLAPGESIAVELEENPTTGYLWKYTLSDDQLLQVVGDTFIPPQNKEGMTGVPGVRRFVFQGLKPGQDFCYLKYIRSWEPNDPARQVELKFTVE